jgi:hypothetical protein
LKGEAGVRVIKYYLNLNAGVFNRNIPSLRDTSLRSGIIPLEYQNFKEVSIFLK